MGGVRGNILGNLVTQIYDEVFELVRVFAECKYDPLDPGDSVSQWAGTITDPKGGVTMGGVSNGQSQKLQSLGQCKDKLWGGSGGTADPQCTTELCSPPHLRFTLRSSSLVIVYSSCLLCLSVGHALFPLEF